MNQLDLTKNEQKVLFGLVTYPEYTDSNLSQKIDVKLSTLTSIKRRLIEQDAFKQIRIPLLNKLNSEILAVIHSEFNPIIPLHERIEKAKELLRDLNRPTKQIAYQTGFESVFYFSRLFKEKTGLTPTQYRRRALGQETDN